MAKTKDPAEIERKVRADPHTAKIAETLGVPLDEYVKGVVEFAMNPEKKPEYLGMSDQVMKEQFGLNPMSMNDIMKTWDRELEIATIADKTDFSDAKKQVVAMPGDQGEKAVTEEDPKLKEELKKQMLGGKARKG